MRRRGGQRHPQGANSGSNGISETHAKLNWLPPAHPIPLLANVHQASDQRLRILDLGVALSSSLGNIESMHNPGTPSFMAPELFEGAVANASTDIYAAGVTLYHLLTRKYPYGEVEPFQHPKFSEPVPPSRYRPDTPYWLENIILKAVARTPEASNKEAVRAVSY